MLNNLTPTQRLPARMIVLTGPGGTIELDRKTIAALAELFVGVLDLNDGDCDIETGDGEDEELTAHALRYARSGPGCDLADTDAAAWPEWSSLGRHKLPSRTQSLPHEDAEQDDEPEDDDADSCSAGDDRGTGNGGNDDGRPGDAEDAEDNDDAEREQLTNDVPVLAVYALEPNPFNGERELLGMNNLQQSFVGGGTLKAVE